MALPLDGVRIELHEEVLDQRRQAWIRFAFLPWFCRGLVTGALHHPAALAADAAGTDMEDLNCGFQLIGAEGDEVSVSSIREHHCLLLHELVNGPQVIAQASRELEFEVLGSLFHFLGETLAHWRGVAVHKADELIDRLTVFLGAYAPDTRRVTFSDVAQQARPAQALMAVVHALRARSHGKHPSQ